ncbi:NAD(P)-binding protein [Earliella scabrosa]|nr:NAD(P)-binding protein [Earliella scabrosa]
MPAIDSGKVLVPDANDFIAMWLVKALLERGFSVRGTVRSAAHGAHLKQTFASYGRRLEYVIVEDIAQDGAFDEAVKNVNAIAHTTPSQSRAREPDELIRHAVKGTTGLLASTAKHGSRVKRVVLTSSSGGPTPASATEPNGPRVLDACNDTPVHEVRVMDREASSFETYCASKVLAERAAWGWWGEHKAQDGLQWDLVVILSPLVLGPWLHKVERVEDLDESLRLYHQGVLKGQMSHDSLATSGAPWVDVRDAAEAHVLAVVNPAAGGERILISAAPFKWQELVTAAWRVEGQKTPTDNMTYEPVKATHHVEHSTEGESSLLGLKYRSLEETTRHMIHEFRCRGWV